MISMMLTNVCYKSNVYPIDGSIQTDKLFVGQIMDYSKLKSLQRKFFSISDGMMSPFQRQILKEPPSCALDSYHDPCWGLRLTNEGPKWVGKCLNTECHQFDTCPCKHFFNEDAYNLFSPHVNKLTGYDYEFASQSDESKAKIDYGENTSYKNFETYIQIHHEKSPTENVKAESHEKTVNPFDVLSRQKASESDISLIEKAPVIKALNDITEFAGEEMQTNETVSDSWERAQISEGIFSAFKVVGQEIIIEADPEDIIFVDAGPGTGKTYALIRRIEHMVDISHVDPQDIIVLSFTNAATLEANSRLHDLVRRGGSRGLRNVDVRTFHRLAWWLLGEANEDEELIARGWEPIPLNLEDSDYDSCIKGAAKLLTRFPDYIRGWKLIVDEVQDLTGAKAAFVIALIKACLICGNGITIFGDYCQAIYDYDMENGAKGYTSEMFYNIVYKILFKTAKFYKLSVNHRQKEPLMSLARDYRNAILSQNSDNARDEVARLCPKIDLSNKTALSVSRDELIAFGDNKTTCLLCRNNGQTLQLSNLLHKRGIPHVVNAYETIENLAPWIAQAFIDYQDEEISKDGFTKILQDKSINIVGYTENDIWERTRELLQTRSEVLNINGFLDAIRTCKIDEPLFRVINTAPIIVSNIHRAKGREYEGVIIDDTFIRELEQGSSSGNIGEHKVLYVALTRPRRALRRMLFVNKWNVRHRTIFDTKRQRWISYGKNGKPSYFELLYSTDVSKSTFLLNSDASSDFSRNVKSGDDILLRRKISGEDVFYEIYHVKDDVETKLGIMNHQLTEDFLALLQTTKPVELPTAVENLYVEFVYSHIDTKDFLALHPQAQAKAKKNIWNWVDFRGLGRLIYDVY